MRRAASLVATFLFVIATVPAKAAYAAEESVALAAFAGETDAYAAGFEVQLVSGLPLPFGVFATRTQGYVDSQPRAQGYAAVVSLPLVELLAATGGLPLPDAIPISDDPPTYCYSNYPGDESAACGPIPPASPANGVEASGGIGRTEAHGDADRPEVTHTRSTVNGLELSAAGLRIRTSTSESDVRIVQGSVVSTTVAALEDVQIAGVLSIQKIEAFARTVARGTAGSATSTSRLTIVGATVGGIPVRITTRGVEAGDAGVPLPTDAVASALSMLQQAQISVIPLTPPVEEVEADGTKAVAAVSGPRVTFEDPNGNHFVVDLGFASASSTAIPAVPLSPIGNGFVPGPVTGPVGGGSLPGTEVVQPPAPVTGPEQPDRIASPPRSAGRPIGERFRTIYSSGMAALALFVIAFAFAARRSRFAGAIERRL